MCAPNASCHIADMLTACHTSPPQQVLEDTLAKDTYLLSRVDGYAVEIRYKSLYSVYKRAKDKRVWVAKHRGLHACSVLQHAASNTQHMYSI